MRVRTRCLITSPTGRRYRMKLTRRDIRDLVLSGYRVEPIGPIADAYTRPIRHPQSRRLPPLVASLPLVPHHYIPRIEQQ
jgi:hypothetical protein